jgi:purine nucleosidase
LAVGVAIRPQFVKSTKFYVDIETQSSICDGQTVCDVQNRLGKDPNVEVCEEVDGESFVDFFIATLGRPVVVHRI